MNIQALPFDLRLWTGVEDDPVQDELIYTRFTERRDRVYDLNRRLSDHPALQDCLLRIPLTQRIFERLCNIPPWSEINRGSSLYHLKVMVLSLLRNRQEAAGITLYLDTGTVEHLYEWSAPANFFPRALAVMQEDWVEMIGMCAFEPILIVREFAPSLPVLATWIVTPYSESSEAQITRRPLEGTSVEECRLPLFFQTDVWTWECRVRQSLWEDERLPFNGPSGPFGYRPSSDWRPGARPRPYQAAYRDSMGGLWEWESGRAVSDQNPFGGHWNVQLPDASVRRRWVAHLQERSGRTIQTRADAISHINVEPDGSIVDMTFAWDD